VARNVLDAGRLFAMGETDDLVKRVCAAHVATEDHAKCDDRITSVSVVSVVIHILYKWCWCHHDVPFWVRNLRTD
jgi:hypothetical protein